MVGCGWWMKFHMLHMPQLGKAATCLSVWSAARAWIPAVQQNAAGEGGCDDGTGQWQQRDVQGHKEVLPLHELLVLEDPAIRRVRVYGEQQESVEGAVWMQAYLALRGQMGRLCDGERATGPAQASGSACAGPWIALLRHGSCSCRSCSAAWFSWRQVACTGRFGQGPAV
jgi:hypothetical protein